MHVCTTTEQLEEAFAAAAAGDARDVDGHALAEVLHGHLYLRALVVRNVHDVGGDRGEAYGGGHLPRPVAPLQVGAEVPRPT